MSINGYVTMLFDYDIENMFVNLTAISNDEFLVKNTEKRNLVIA